MFETMKSINYARVTVEKSNVSSAFCKCHDIVYTVKTNHFPTAFALHCFLAGALLFFYDAHSMTAFFSLAPVTATMRTTCRFFVCVVSFNFILVFNFRIQFGCIVSFSCTRVVCDVKPVYGISSLLLRAELSNELRVGVSSVNMQISKCSASDAKNPPLHSQKQS